MNPTFLDAEDGLDPAGLDPLERWPDLGMFLGPTPTREAVAGWAEPWRRSWSLKAAALMEGGMGWREAEDRAREEVEESRRNPRESAKKLVGGGAVVRDAVARPRMLRKSLTKKDRRIAREEGGGLFDGLDDGNERSTTYQIGDA